MLLRALPFVLLKCVCALIVPSTRWGSDSLIRPLSGGLIMASAAGGGVMVDGVRVGPPPDLPSLLLHNHIVYCGMPLVPAVTELLVAQLLYLSSECQIRPIHLYINSPGGEAGGAVETEAFAIADTMNFVSVDVETICVGTAYGTAAMLLASGAKGKRSCLPNSSIMLHQPHSQVQGQASDIKIQAQEILAARDTIISILSETTGQPVEKVRWLWAP